MLNSGAPIVVRPTVGSTSSAGTCDEEVPRCRCHGPGLANLINSEEVRMKRVSQPSAGITTALIYTRVSSDEQAREGISLDAQLAECRRYAVAHGWDLGDEYQDVMTGTARRPPTVPAAAVRSCVDSTPTVDVLWSWSLPSTDLGADSRNRLRCREELKTLGVSVHSVRDGGEVSDFVANVLASAAEEEVRRLGERIRASIPTLPLAAGITSDGRLGATSGGRPRTKNGATVHRDPCSKSTRSSAPYVREAFDRLRPRGFHSLGRQLAVSAP